MAQVVVDDVTKIFPGPKGAEIRAVNHASLVVQDGEFLVVTGPSGSGKSTLLRLIAGLEEIAEGTISIGGQVMNRVEPKDRDLAMVFQSYALYPHLTARENLAFGLKLRKTPAAETARRVGEAAEMLGLNECLDRPPQELSGGQRQRVAVGRALVLQPKVFLFDEPLSNLDPAMRVQMRRELSRLHSRLAATMVYVTHDQVEAMTLGDRLAVMNAGSIQQVADPMTVYCQPANLFVAGFIGSPAMNVFHGSLARRDGHASFLEKVSSASGGKTSFTIRLDDATAARLNGRLGEEIIFGIRPEHITWRTGPANLPAENLISAKVETVELLGAETYLYAQTGGGHTLVARLPFRQPPKPGEGITLALEMTEAHFFAPAGANDRL